MGTIPLFVGILTGIAAVVVGLFFLGIYLFAFTGFWLSVVLAIPFAALMFLLILNIPVPRRRIDPKADLEGLRQIAEGAWCTVHKAADDTNVIKQIYPCGWGHNDYTQHTAPVIGKEKYCGPWTPFCLWIIHNYMIWYQLIGLRRRQQFEGMIDAFPATTNLQSSKLRYSQPHIPVEFTPENCPDDVVEQFEKLNKQLKACGLYLDDVHARNVRLTEDGKIQIIDGELYSGGEEWVKTGLVKFFNGQVVSGMEKVLGNSHIVAWVDHRMSVDEVVNSKNTNLAPSSNETSTTNHML